MTYTINKKEIEFRYLTEEDIDVIEEQIKNYENAENIEFDVESFYKIYAYSDVCHLGGDEYDIDIHIKDMDEDYAIFISLNHDNITEDIAKEYEKELNKYLLFKFINLAINNL